MYQLECTVDKFTHSGSGFKYRFIYIANIISDFEIAGIQYTTKYQSDAVYISNIAEHDMPNMIYLILLILILRSLVDFDTDFDIPNHY